MTLTTLALFFIHLPPGKRAEFFKYFIDFIHSNTKTFTLHVLADDPESGDRMFARMHNGIFTFGKEEYEEDRYTILQLNTKRAAEYEEILTAFIQATFEQIELQIRGIDILHNLDDKQTAVG